VSDVTAPALGAWWDADAALTNVLHRLRLTDADIDADRIAALIPVAGRLIDEHLDRQLAADADPTLQHALEQVVLDLYLFAPDPLANALGIIPGGLKERWGVA
jgi:hypothetical protein